MSKTLKNLALDVYNGKNVMFNEVSGEQAIRNAIKEVMGDKMDFYSFHKNKIAIFEILSEVIELPMQQLEKEILPGIVRFSQVNFGDAKEIVFKQKKLLRVARTVLNGDLRRQRIVGLDRKTVKTEWYGIAVYEELELFLAERTSFAEFVEAINRSFENAIAKMINVCFGDAVDNLSATYKETGAFVEETMLSLIEKVSAKNEGLPVRLYGTKSALAKVSSAQNGQLVSDSQKDEYAALRHFSKFYNVEMIEMKQMYDDKMQPIVDDNTVYILPELDLIHVVQEGTDIVTEPNNQDRTDLSINMQVSKKLGVECVFGAYFGAYVLA